MFIEYWSREEIEEYCENPNLLIAKANELRRQIIRDLLVRAFHSITSRMKLLVRRIAAMLKQLVKQPA